MRQYTFREGALVVLWAMAGGLLGGANGAERTWIGPADGNWFQAANWDPPAGAPAPADTLTVLVGTPVAHGEAAVSNGGSIVASGPLAALTFDRLLVGRDGAGTLAVEANAVVWGEDAAIGWNDGAEGMVTVEGEGSVWELAGSLQMGGGQYADGGGSSGGAGVGRLFLRDGGRVSCGGQAWLAFSAGSTAEVWVRGAEWHSGGVFVGARGSGTFGLESGAVATCTTASIGLFGEEGSDGNGLAVVDDAEWAVANTLYVGVGGVGRMEVANGGRVSNGSCYVGETGLGSVAIAGEGTRWETDGVLTVAAQGTGSVQAGAGAAVTCSQLRVGGGSDGNGSVTIDGATLDVTGLASIGALGEGRLAARNGASVTSQYAVLGETEGAGRVTIDDANWANEQTFTIGLAGRGEVRVVHGGAVTTTDATVGSGPDANGALAVEGSTWTCLDSLAVGGAGQARLAVEAGGVVEAASVHVGSAGGATGSLRGAGSLLAVAGDLTVGDGNGWGVLEVWPGAALSVGGDVVLGENAYVFLSGGTARFAASDPLYHAGGSFYFHHGTVAFEGDWVLHGGNSSLAALLGSVPTLSAGRTLQVTGTATLLTEVVLDGGTLDVGGLTHVDLLDFRRGTLRLRDANVSVGPEGLFGQTLTLGAGQAVDVLGDAVVAPSGRVELNGGTFSAVGLVNQGVVRGAGVLGGTVTNAAGGELRVGAGESLLLTGEACRNDGVLEAIGGEIELRGETTNRAGAGRIAAREATLRFVGGLTNEHRAAFSFGTSDVHGPIHNAAAGRIVVSGGANVTFYGDVTNDGDIRVSAGCTAVWLGDVAGAGSFPGAGTNYFEGDLRPGQSPHVLAFGGDVVLGAVASLHVELAEPDNTDALRPRYDALSVGGDVVLAGELTLRWLPRAGDPNCRFGGAYDILTYAGDLDGEFSAVGGSIGAAYVAAVDSAADAGEGLRAVRVTLYDLLDGDCDLDGDVDGDDLAVIRAGLHGSDPNWLDGDVSLDGVVDHLDYLLWKANAGRSVPNGTAPEPAALGLLLAGAAWLASRRRRVLRS